MKEIRNYYIVRSWLLSCRTVEQVEAVERVINRLTLKAALDLADEALYLKCIMITYQRKIDA
jgi:hypothetical protein